MADILHRVGIRSVPTERVYDALTTVDGLAGWWAEKTSGRPALGGTLEFRFGLGGIDMRVVELDPGRRVQFMHHCTTKWGTFLLSLKQLLESGTGAPEPRDVQISDWH